MVERRKTRNEIIEIKGEIIMEIIIGEQYTETRHLRTCRVSSIKNGFVHYEYDSGNDPRSCPVEDFVIHFRHYNRLEGV